MMTQKSCPHPRNYVDPRETLTRFVFDPKQISNDRISQNAFKVGKDNALSVYRTSKCAVDKIWDICEKHVDGDKKAIARFELAAQAYLDKSLAFAPDGKPHTRHTNVVGWNTEKPADLVRRQELAAMARPIIKPN